MAQVKEITVRAARTFNHPYERFSNLRPEVTWKAMLEPGDDPRVVTQELQAEVESLMDKQKEKLIRQLAYTQDIVTREGEDIPL
jgi:hypothetical protein